MKTPLPKSINSILEAKVFLHSLFHHGESFHPEDDANDIIWPLEAPTEDECNHLNMLMNHCYSVANERFDPCGYLLNLQEYRDKRSKI